MHAARAQNTKLCYSVQQDHVAIKRDRCHFRIAACVVAQSLKCQSPVEVMDWILN